MSQATQADADIVLKLYDMRREPVMRDARKWFLLEFWPKSAEDVLKVTSAFGTQENAYFRQVISYWEMSASLVLNGAVHPDLFMDWSGEMVFFFAKLYPILKDIRDKYNAGFWLKTETVINQTNRMKAVEAAMQRQKGMGPVKTAKGKAKAKRAGR